MSRRKQLHPKPIKRKAEDDLQELALSLQLPTEALTIKVTEDSDFSCQTVFTKKCLVKGTTFGPYKGRVIKQSSSFSKKSYTEDETPGEEQIYLQLNGEGGQWIKILKTALSKEEANVIVSVEGHSVWCTVCCDARRDKEIIAWYEVSSQPSSVDEEILTEKNIILPKGCYPCVKKRLLVKKKDSVTVKTKDTSVGSSEKRKKVAVKNRVRSLSTSDSSTSTSVHSEDCHASTSHESPNLDSTLEKNGCKESPELLSPLPILQPTVSPGGQIFYLPLVASQDQDMSRGSVHVVKKHGGYRCDPCGITFSSEKTLLAHKTFYCSHRQEMKHDVSFPVQNTNQEEPIVEISANSVESKPKKEEAREENCSKNSVFQVDVTKNHLTLDTHGKSESKITPSKFEKFRCLYCFYASDKKSGLTRHMRIHETPGSYTSESSSPHSRYCSLCHIQFCSMNTFQVHKKHYCNSRKVQVPQTTSLESRLVESQSLNVQDSEESKLRQIHNLGTTEPLINSCPYTSSNDTLNSMSHLPAAVVKTITSNVVLPSATIKHNGLLLSESDPTCYSSVRNSLPLEIGVSCDNLLCIQGSNMSLESDNQQENSPMKNCGEVLKKKHKKEILETQPSCVLDLDKCSEHKAPECPIDLTVGKNINSANALSEHSQSSSDENITDPVICKSECHQKIETQQPYTTMKTESSCALSCGLLPPHLKMSCHKPALVHSNNPFCDVPSSSTHSQVLVKQGSSQCKECNIVFYKYENYMIHKQNYCASRQQKTKHNIVTPSVTSSMIIDTESQKSRTRNLEIDSSKMAAAVNKTLENLPSQPTERQYFQFFCLACGVKFISLKNLKAHQTYYCPKPSEMVGLTSEQTPQGLMCNRCRMCYTSEEEFRSHPCFIPIQNFIFSPFDALSMLSSATADRNMFNEASSFKCRFCGYIGHTVRGMRTHVRAHLEANASSLEDPNSTCFDEDKNRHQNRELPTHLTTATDEKEKRSVSKSTHPLQNDDKNISLERHQEEDNSPINLTESTPASSKNNDNNPKYSFSLFESMATRSRQPSEGVHNTCSKREYPFAETERRSPENSPVHQIQNETQVSFKMGDDRKENVKTEEFSVLASSFIQDTIATRGLLKLSKDKEIIARSSSDDEPSDAHHQFLNEQLHWCMLCPYYSKYKGNVVRHIQNTHKDLVNPQNTTMFLLSSSTFFQDINKTSNDDEASNLSKESNTQTESYINCKELKQDSDTDEHLGKDVQQNNRSKRKVSNENRLTRKDQGPKFCKSCNISFKYLPSFIAHKKYYCSSHDRETISHEV